MILGLISKIIYLIFTVWAVYYVIVTYGPGGFRANRLKRKGDELYRDSIQQLDRLIEGKGFGDKWIKKYNKKSYSGYIKERGNFKDTLEDAKKNFVEAFVAYNSYSDDQVQLAKYWYEYNLLVNRYLNAWEDSGIIDYDLDDIYDIQAFRECYETIFKSRYEGKDLLKHTKTKKDQVRLLKD